MSAAQTKERGRLLTEAMTQVSEANTAIHAIDLRTCPQDVRDAVRAARESLSGSSTLVRGAIEKHLETTRVKS